MSASDKMPAMMTADEEGNQNFLHGEASFGQNFDGVAYSPFGQVGSMNDEFGPVTHDMNPNMFDNKDPSEDDEDAQSESELPAETPPSDTKRGMKRKHYQRHTQEQIQGMETFFKHCPHPDEKQRKELGRQLNLEHLQVKFWFQNKRTQIKAQHERRESSQLRADNERLRDENKELKQTIPDSACRKCGNTWGDALAMEEKRLRSENNRLKEKIEHIKLIASHFLGHVPDSFLNQEPVEFGKQPDDLLISSGDNKINNNGSQSYRVFEGLTDLDKSLIIQLADSSVEEVSFMARIGEPIWIPNFQHNTIVLDDQEYQKRFQPQGFVPKKLGFKPEASRDFAVVMLNPQNIVMIFMELNKWLAVFSGIVAKAMLLELISAGQGMYDGCLQLMSAEFQVLSPAVPTRDCVFVRYCKQISEETWAVVDVSVDTILPRAPTAKCYRRPSGCIIRALPNDCSQITWVEHVEVQDEITYSLSNPVVDVGDLYGAKRWISILRRQCERLAGAMGKADFPFYEELNDMVIHPEGRQSLRKLAERMVLGFSGGVSASGGYQWTTVSGNGVDAVRIMTRNSFNNPGIPNGLTISASICFWIPTIPKIAFDYLRNHKNRPEWDILCVGGDIKEVAYMGNGQDEGNCVSILRLNGPNTDEGNVLIFQESSCESTTSFIVYAPVDVASAKVLFGGGDPENIQLLPSGFTVIPSGPPVGLILGESRANDHGGANPNNNSNNNNNGTLLSISFQILVESDPFSKLSVGSIANVNNLMESTMDNIKIALAPYYF